MPIGYIVGNQYRLDHNIDRFSALEVWKKLLREAGKAELMVEIKYSHIGRNYSAEVFRLMRFKHSAQLYTVSGALRHHASPLLAMVEALRVAFGREGFSPTPLIRVLWLEAEVTSLSLAYQDAKAREAAAAKVEQERRRSAERVLGLLLDELRGVLDTIPITFKQGNTVLAVESVGRLRGKAIKVHPAMLLNTGYDEDDDL
jgi:hypothetical protein